MKLIWLLKQFRSLLIKHSQQPIYPQIDKLIWLKLRLVLYDNITKLLKYYFISTVSGVWAKIRAPANCNGPVV